MDVRLEVVEDAAVLLGNGTQVRTVLEAALSRQGGDVFSARLGPSLFGKREFGQGLVNVAD